MVSRQSNFDILRDKLKPGSLAPKSLSQTLKPLAQRARQSVVLFEQMSTQRWTPQRVKQVHPKTHSMFVSF